MQTKTEGQWRPFYFPQMAANLMHQFLYILAGQRSMN